MPKKDLYLQNNGEIGNAIERMKASTIITVDNTILAKYVNNAIAKSIDVINDVFENEADNKIKLTAVSKVLEIGKYIDSKIDAPKEKPEDEITIDELDVDNIKA